jgi:peptidoglycan-associated lipoprotein
MDVKHAMHTVLAVGLCLFLLAGCGKKDVDSSQVSESMKPEGNLIGSTTGPESTRDGDGSVTAGDLEALTETGVNPLEPDTTSEEYRSVYGRSTAPLYPVFFEFDSSTIPTDQLDNLNSSGSHLLVNDQLRLVVEGNCDARGTTDYNLALGELRALSVKRYLVNVGVAEARIKTISYGSQRPLFPGNDEESWAMNRRADLVIP